MSKNKMATVDVAEDLDEEIEDGNTMMLLLPFNFSKFEHSRLKIVPSDIAGKSYQGRLFVKNKETGKEGIHFYFDFNNIEIDLKELENTK